ncbi:endonuclease [Shewanella pneumatophori]|uniref:Endonuclease n=1 Tax=Shewanella pneumatophori TaxID=314092 RepID=A0A9X1ZE27_9GAMM|nr:endonuclease [Shewanella pneumatophori]MCL1139958.1 endonuclease [Shewanella pneumatophori]
MKIRFIFAGLITVFSLPIFAQSYQGNTSIHSFNKAKKTLERQVYHDHRITLYCDAKFDKNKNITLPNGFTTEKHVKRAKRVEWEHVVPAENFGRTFSEWRDGHSDCVNNKGKNFKGRKCAEKMNNEYRLMQSDLYNLYPAVGAVNATRSNYNFAMLPSSKSSFGVCEVKVHGRKVEPTIGSRGRIARTYLYMEQAYPRFRLSNQQKQLMNAWDKQFPVSEWECKRAKRIERIQKNRNHIVYERCEALNAK